MALSESLLSPFEQDITDQSPALMKFADAALPAELHSVLTADYERIVLTGMGSSHFAALPTWRSFVAQGRPAWWVDSSQLLDSPELVTPDTLLIATSQSGASGEVVALLESTHPRDVLGITNKPESPLGEASSVCLQLHSGDEATVSTKSYLNTLAAHRALLNVSGGNPVNQAVRQLSSEVAAFNPAAQLAPVAADFVGAQHPRLAYVGFDDNAATALYAGLITKEGAKVPAEGFIGGQFRHGPLELAGPGLCAVLFVGGKDGSGSSFNAVDSINRLARELSDAGSSVVLVGDADGIDTNVGTFITAPGDALTQLALGAVTAQHLTVEIAKARGITPGAFAFGNKVTTAL